MTQHLILVSFDGGVALRPLARLVDSYAPGAREWQGWTHELDEDRGVLRLTSPKQDASKIPEHLRGAAAEVVVFFTEIPLHRCAMTWAEIEPVEVAQDATTPAAASGLAAWLPAPGEAGKGYPGDPLQRGAPVDQPTIMRLMQMQPTGRPVNSPAQNAAQAPPTRRRLPPGARPVAEPPPSVINAKPEDPPPFSSALVVE